MAALTAYSARVPDLTVCHRAFEMIRDEATERPSESYSRRLPYTSAAREHAAALFELDLHQLNGTVSIVFNGALFRSHLRTPAPKLIAAM